MAQLKILWFVRTRSMSFSSSQHRLTHCSHVIFLQLCFLGTVWVLWVFCWYCQASLLEAVLPLDFMPTPQAWGGWHSAEAYQTGTPSPLIAQCGASGQHWWASACPARLCGKVTKLFLAFFSALLLSNVRHCLRNMQRDRICGISVCNSQNSQKGKKESTKLWWAPGSSTACSQRGPI